MEKWLIILMLPFAAAVSITSIDGELEHGSLVTIRGTGFGAKEPAAPLLWDDGEGATLGTSAALLGGTAVRNDGKAGWDDALPRDNHDLSADRHCAIAYRQGFMGVSQAHPRSETYIAGAHCANPAGAQLNNVQLNYITSGGVEHQRLLLMFYASLHPDWDPASSGINYGSLDNYKEIWVNDGTTFTGGRDTDAFYLGGGWPYYTGQPASLGSNGDGGKEYCPGGTSSYDTGDLHRNVGSWAKRILTVDYIDNRISYESLDGNSRMGEIEEGCSFGGDGNFGSVICVGAYARYRGDGNCAHPQEGDNCVHDGMIRYFDDIYIDNTLARVVLTDKPDYETATVIEPQLPETWSMNMITAKLNFGALSDSGPKYLFVFDESGLHSEPLLLGISCIHPADDNPCDGEISMVELDSVISSWRAGSIALHQLMEAIMLWKG
jgi:hypothetical protein